MPRGLGPAIAGLALVMVALALAACSGAPPAPSPAGSGSPSAAPGSTATSVPSLAGGPPRVEGKVAAGPTCPVERPSPDPKCAPRPVAGAVIVATDPDGQEIGRATSAADGSFELLVDRTGSVVLTAQPVAGLMGTPGPVTVVLTSPGQVEHVDLAYDTGIR